jgi:muramoyltetrapeptide carboxypeptidase
VEPLPEPERRHLYFAGTDAERAEAFQRAYFNPAVKALFITRGGYGAARLLDLLDAKRFKASPPKHVVGFSDATSLFAWLHAIAGIRTVHGPALAAPGALTSPSRKENLAALHQLLFDEGHVPEFAVRHFAGAIPESALRGRVIGGCLTVLQTTLGTPWAPKPKGAILFLEEVGEQPYRVDRMLNHLRQCGMFDGLKAIVLGHFTRCDDNPPGLLRECLLDLLDGITVPVYEGMAAGHGEPNLAFPLGAEATLLSSGNAATLRFD